MNIGTAIKKIRKEKDFSQEYVAYKLEMSQANYSKIERGCVNISLENFLKLADLFEMEIIVFLQVCGQTDRQTDRQTDQNFGR